MKNKVEIDKLTFKKFNKIIFAIMDIMISIGAYIIVDSVSLVISGIKVATIYKLLILACTAAFIILDFKLYKFDYTICEMKKDYWDKLSLIFFVQGLSFLVLNYLFIGYTFSIIGGLLIIFQKRIHKYIGKKYK